MRANTSYQGACTCGRHRWVAAGNCRSSIQVGGVARTAPSQCSMSITGRVLCCKQTATHSKAYPQVGYATQPACGEYSTNNDVLNSLDLDQSRLVGSEMCIRDRVWPEPLQGSAACLPLAGCCAASKLQLTVRHTHRLVCHPTSLWAIQYQQ